MADGGDMAERTDTMTDTTGIAGTAGTVHTADGTDTEDLIAIVGMAGRFPGADSVPAFWQNAVAGTEALVRYSRDELIAAGEDPALVDDPDYVASGMPLADHDRFDAKAFGYTAREARLMDPQVRIFLECAWQALEDAGYDPTATPSGPPCSPRPG